MSSRYLKILLALILAAAIFLGLSRREPMFERAKNSFMPQAQTQATFLAMGDIMLSRDVARQMQRANNPSLPFQGVETLLESTDFNFGNLEAPITDRTTLPETNSFVFNVPTALASGLPAANFSVLTLANNHAYDQGPAGAQFTRQWLSKNHIQVVGTGLSLAQAWQGQVITVNDIRIGFIGAAYGSGKSSGRDFLANIKNTEQLRQSINNLRPQADFIVIAMHAGEEYAPEPTKAQIDFAHAAIEAGADLVIGAHPHVIQPMEKYHDKYIFYSLGNFIFDQEWNPETKQGLALKIVIEKTAGQANLKQIELIPVVIEHFCCPRLATEAEAKNILEKINIFSPFIVPN